jgi:hypothetical protein
MKPTIGFGRASAVAAAESGMSLRSAYKRRDLYQSTSSIMSPEEDLAGHAPAQEETISKSPASSTPPPMSLKDLVESTPAQEEAIRELITHLCHLTNYSENDVNHIGGWSPALLTSPIIRVMPPKEHLAGRNSASPTLSLMHHEDIATHTLYSPLSRWTPLEEMPIALLEEELTGHIDTQEEAIADLLAHPARPLRTLEPLLPDWGCFRGSLWDKGLSSFQKEEFVERGSSPIASEEIPGRLPLTSFLVTPPKYITKLWRPRSQRILVRSEYYEAEEAALSASKDKDVFEVTGQPGIGPFSSLSVARRT